MPEEEQPLILHPGRALALVGPQGGRIVSEMVTGALALSRAAQTASMALVPRFKIGEHEFCEPDYRQILLWADSLGMNPAAVLEKLIEAEPPPWVGLDRHYDPDEGDDCFYKTRIENGRLIRLCLDLQSLPLTELQWADGLGLESLVFNCLREQQPHLPPKLLRTLVRLPFPRLRVLHCCHMGLTELDLSDLPNLTRLECTMNQLTKLDLSNAPNLRLLDCSFNKIAEIKFGSAPKLVSLICHSNKLTQLDLSDAGSLIKLNCNCNKLELLRLPMWLERLSCNANQLQDLDLSTSPFLEELECFSNHLKILDLSWSVRLNSLCCFGNQIESLDVRISSLRKLTCDAHTALIRYPEQSLDTWVI